MPRGAQACCPAIANLCMLCAAAVQADVAAMDGPNLAATWTKLYRCQAIAPLRASPQEGTQEDAQARTAAALLQTMLPACQKLASVAVVAALDIGVAAAAAIAPQASH